MRIPLPALAMAASIAGHLTAQTPVRTKAVPATVATPATKLQTLTPIGPTGAPVAGLTVTGTPLVASLSWTPAPNAASYQVFRSDGPNAQPVLITPNPLPPKAATGFRNTVPDPRISYQFLVVASYTDGTTGEARATWVSPPPTNPTAVTARDLGNGSFSFTWPAVPGAIGYRVDGPSLPNTGQTTSIPSTTINNVPAGPQSYGVVAMFPGNIADYNTSTKANIVSRPLPAHPPFLMKSNGPGDPASATFSLERATVPGSIKPSPCNSPNNADRCTLSELIMSTALGSDFPSGEPSSDVLKTPYISFTNTTELGTTRKSRCYESAPKAIPALICYTFSPDAVTAIVQTDKGHYFAVFKPGQNPGSSSGGYATLLGSLTKTFDSEGPKFAPHACLSCHGGRYDPASGIVYGATLLPIDPGLVDFGGTRAQNEEAVRYFNSMIYRPPAGKPSAAVAQYINEMYGGTGPVGDAVMVKGAVAAPNHVPRGWQSEAGFYQNIVKPNCAMCHLAVAPQLNLNFLSSGNFLQHKDAIFNAICKAKSMPHAETPFRKFWTADTGPIYVPGVMAVRLGRPACA